jgi:hypothetical protein
MTSEPPSAQHIAERGTNIYRRKYLSDFERKWRGRYAAIDIDTEQAYVADYPELALSEARSAAPNGYFYLIRIGSSGAFKTARLVLNANSRLV